MADLFFSRDRFLAPRRRRGAYLITLALLFLLTEVGTEIYRPFLYQNSIQDLGFADVVGNLLGTIAMVFFPWAWRMRTGPRASGLLPL